MTRGRAAIALAGALAVVATSFGVAAAGEKRAPIYFDSDDCGCTGQARAEDRAARKELGIELPPPAPATAPQPQR